MTNDLRIKSVLWLYIWISHAGQFSVSRTHTHTCLHEIHIYPHMHKSFTPHRDAHRCTHLNKQAHTYMCKHNPPPPPRHMHVCAPTSCTCMHTHTLLMTKQLTVLFKAGDGWYILSTVWQACLARHAKLIVHPVVCRCLLPVGKAEQEMHTVIPLPTLKIPTPALGEGLWIWQLCRHTCIQLPTTTRESHQTTQCAGTPTVMHCWVAAKVACCSVVLHR